MKLGRLTIIKVWRIVRVDPQSGMFINNRVAYKDIAWYVQSSKNAGRWNNACHVKWFWSVSYRGRTYNGPEHIRSVL